MNKILMLIIGIIMSSSGLFLMILNLNLILFGYSFWEYVKVISSSFAGWLFILGMLLNIFVIYGRRVKSAILSKVKSKYK